VELAQSRGWEGGGVCGPAYIDGGKEKGDGTWGRQGSTRAIYKSRVSARNTRERKRERGNGGSTNRSCPRWRGGGGQSWGEPRERGRNQAEVTR
jgi:hypothetical protein